MYQVFHQAGRSDGILVNTIERKKPKVSTFNTSLGCYCYCRLPYGIMSTSEVFYKTMQQIFDDTDGVKVYIDDLVIWGENKEQHDERLFQSLDQARQVNLTLNLNKCEFKVRKTTYLGEAFFKGGVQPDPENIELSQKCLIRAQRKMYKDYWAWQIM